jgi:hypothetical protein
VGVQGDVFLLTEKQRMELQAINREYLESTPIEAEEIASGKTCPIDNQALTPSESL